MSYSPAAQSVRELGWWRSRTTKKALLTGGIMAGILYLVADVLAGVLYPDYSFKDQTISELGAVGSPTRLLFSVLVTIHTVLVGAFGVAVWRVAGRSRSLRWVGGLLIAVAVIGLTVGTFSPMSVRGAEQGLAGALHLVYIAVNSVLIMVAMGVSAASFGWRFRLYVIGSILLMLGFGAWTGTFKVEVEANLPTPWAGVIERVGFYAWLAWLVVLATALLRHRLTPSPSSSTERSR